MQTNNKKLIAVLIIVSQLLTNAGMNSLAAVSGKVLDDSNTFANEERVNYYYEYEYKQSAEYLSLQNNEGVTENPTDLYNNSSEEDDIYFD